MAITNTFELASESWDDKIRRLANLTLDSTTLAHWGLPAGTNVASIFDTVKTDLLTIQQSHGMTQNFDANGFLVTTYPTDVDASNANLAMSNYTANLTTANISLESPSTRGYANNWVITKSVTFVEYINEYYGEANVSLSA